MQSDKCIDMLNILVGQCSTDRTYYYHSLITSRVFIAQIWYLGPSSLMLLLLKTKIQGYRTILLCVTADYTYTTTKMMPKIKTEFDYDEEWTGISQVKTEPTSPGINLHRPQERQLMRPWLWDRLENQDVPGITTLVKIRYIVVT